MTKRCQRVVQVTDLHLAAEPGHRVHGYDTDATAAAVLAHVAANAPDLVVLSGDLTDEGERAAYERLMEMLEALACPVVPLPGNHDCAETLSAVAAAHGRALPGRLDLGAWRLHFLDSSQPGRSDGELGPERLARLRRNLRPGPSLTFVHHHPVPVDSPWIDAMGLVDGDDLMALLAGQDAPTVVAAGHVHQAVTGWHGDVRWVTSPSTCSQALPHADRFIDDDRVGPGYRLFELFDDGRWTTEVVRPELELPLR